MHTSEDLHVFTRPCDCSYIHVHVKVITPYIIIRKNKNWSRFAQKCLNENLTKANTCAHDLNNDSYNSNLRQEWEDIRLFRFSISCFVFLLQKKRQKDKKINHNFEMLNIMLKALFDFLFAIWYYMSFIVKGAMGTNIIKRKIQRKCVGL